MAITNKEKLQRLTDLIKDIDGDFAEIGVSAGRCFKQLVPIAHAAGKVAHAYDSFVGMNHPSDKDLGQYQKGKYNIGGVDAFRDIMSNARLDENHYKLFDGYIPDCFSKCKTNQMYSFIYLDVDHYEATKTALPWCWEHLNVNGMLLLDDWFPNVQGLASLAIREWLDETNNYKQLEHKNTQLALIKT